MHVGAVQGSDTALDTLGPASLLDAEVGSYFRNNLFSLLVCLWDLSIRAVRPGVLLHGLGK